MSERSNKATAAVVTTVFHAIVAALLIWLCLDYTGSQPRKWPPEDTSELLLEGEYVKIGDIPVPQKTTQAPAPQSADERPEAPAQADDMTDAGEPAESTPPLQTQKAESPVKVKPEPKPEKTGPSKAELEAQARAKREAETQQRINNRVSFGKNNSSSAAAGNAGSPSGNSSAGALSGKPGFNLRGRTLESWSSPKGRETGVIVVAVRVDREGRVVEAKYQSGSGGISTDNAARRSCEQAARASRFSIDRDARAEQTGTITYRFE